MLKNIINFRFIFAISFTLTTILIGITVIVMPNAVYSLSYPAVPNDDTIRTVTNNNNNNNNNKEIILNFDDGYKSQYTHAKPILDNMDIRLLSI